MLLTAVDVDEGIRFPLVCLKIQSILIKNNRVIQKRQKKRCPIRIYYSLRGLDVGILSLLVLIRHLIFLLGSSSKKTEDHAQIKD